MTMMIIQRIDTWFPSVKSVATVFPPRSFLELGRLAAGAKRRIDLDTGRVRGDFDPEQIRAEARAIFDEASERLLEHLGS